MPPAPRQPCGSSPAFHVRLGSFAQSAAADAYYELCKLVDPHLNIDGFERTPELLHRAAYPIAAQRPPRLQAEELEVIRE